jgi:bacteriocin biosynthesis cyclodehydratase domain-containing protein
MRLWKKPLMLSRPRFKNSYCVKAVGEQQVFLLNEHDYIVLEGRACNLLAPLLDGRRTVEEILAELDGEVALAEAIYTLRSLEEKGYVVEAEDGLPEDRAAFWEYLDLDGGAAALRLSEVRVSIRTVGDVDGALLAGALQGMGIEVDEAGEYEVVVAGDYLEEELGEINERALSSGRPWMLIKPVGMVIWIGPIFRPGETGCWACLAQRLRANRQVEGYIQRHMEIAQPLRTSRAALPATLGVAAGMAAVEVAKWLGGGVSEDLEGQIVTLDLLTLQMAKHALVKRPQCPSCGEERYRGEREPRPVELCSQKKRFTVEGGHRAVSPQETFGRYKHHISPITGVVSSIISKEDASHGYTHSYSSGHYFPMETDNMLDLRTNLRSRSGGKGITDIEAKVGALCEAIERYSGVFSGDEFTIHGSF